MIEEESVLILLKACFSVGLSSSVFFSYTSPNGDLAVPIWSVQGMCLPAVDVNALVFNWRFKVVPVTFSLASHCSVTLAERAREQWFWQSPVRRPHNVSSP